MPTIMCHQFPASLNDSYEAHMSRFNERALNILDF
jgi:hypothetical protein